MALGDKDGNAKVEGVKGMRKEWFPTMGRFFAFRATNYSAITLARSVDHNSPELASTESVFWVVNVEVPVDKVRSWYEAKQAHVFPGSLRYHGDHFDLKGLKYSIEKVLFLRGVTEVIAAPNDMVVDEDERAADA